MPFFFTYSLSSLVPDQLVGELALHRQPGAPGGGGGFEPLSSYAERRRNARELDISEIIQSLEIDTGAELVEESSV